MKEAHLISKLLQPLIEEKQFSPDDFPIFMAHMGRRKADFQEKALPIINAAYATGSIYNVDIKPVSSLINAALEDAFDSYWRNDYFSRPREERDDVSNDIDYMAWESLHLFPTLLKKLQKLQKANKDNTDLNALIPYVEEIVPLANAMKSIKKGEIIKGKKVTTDNPVKQKYAPPPAKKEDLEKVHKVLSALTEKFRKELVQNRIDQPQKVVTLFKEMKLKDPTLRFAHQAFPRDGDAKLIMQSLLGSTGEIRIDANVIIQEKAVQYAEDVLSKFIFKNMAKLTTIVGGKGNLKDVKLLRSSFGNNGLEGSLKLSFEDKSSFEVDTKTVWSQTGGSRWTSGGKTFIKYPTTFHNVILPDGSKLKTPSEQKMNSSFLGI